MKTAQVLRQEQQDIQQQRRELEVRATVNMVELLRSRKAELWQQDPGGIFDTDLVQMGCGFNPENTSQNDLYKRVQLEDRDSLLGLFAELCDVEKPYGPVQMLEIWARALSQSRANGTYAMIGTHGLISGSAPRALMFLTEPDWVSAIVSKREKARRVESLSPRVKAARWIEKIRGTAWMV